MPGRSPRRRTCRRPRPSSPARLGGFSGIVKAPYLPNPLPAVNQPPQKWEYVTIQETIFPLNPLRITVESEDRALANALQGKTVAETLNYMGDRGWELVTVGMGLEKNAQVFYFKRPKQ